MRRQLLHCLEAGRVGDPRVVRVDADRRVEADPARALLRAVYHRQRVVVAVEAFAGADTDDVGDPGGRCPLEGGAEVVGEALAVEVGMAVEEHGAQPLARRVGFFVSLLGLGPFLTLAFLTLATTSDASQIRISAGIPSDAFRARIIGRLRPRFRLRISEAWVFYPRSSRGLAVRAPVAPFGT